MMKKLLLSAVVLFMGMLGVQAQDSKIIKEVQIQRLHLLLYM